MSIVRRLIMNSAMIATALSMTVACGDQDILTRVEVDEAKIEAVALETETNQEALTASFVVSPEVELKLSIVNREDQLITVSYGTEVLFEQRLDYEGAIKELRTGNISVSVNQDNQVDLANQPKLKAHLADCYDRKIRCYLDALEALSSLQAAHPEAFAGVNGENAAMGLEAIRDAVDYGVLADAPAGPTATQASVKPADLVDTPLFNLGQK